jgi:adenine phosphoribosyltransferase
MQDGRQDAESHHFGASHHRLWIVFDLQGFQHFITYDVNNYSLCVNHAFAPGARVLIVDDLLATGGTAVAAATLVETAGGVVAGFAFLVNLAFLPGAQKLAKYDTQYLVEYA